MELDSHEALPPVFEVSERKHLYPYFIDEETTPSQTTSQWWNWRSHTLYSSQLPFQTNPEGNRVFEQKGKASMASLEACVRK